jgi:hypothetical protein
LTICFSTIQLFRACCETIKAYNRWFWSTFCQPGARKIKEKRKKLAHACLIISIKIAFSSVSFIEQCSFWGGSIIYLQKILYFAAEASVSGHISTNIMPILSSGQATGWATPKARRAYM